ncbi:sulfotransferase family protein [Pleionea litopenaei]|uniref:Sulfotransferase n=1 Tax=Pleionea litopenaei TaxID=3070815 RepID=A0AA51X5J9_9GAMM|nr:sulfotransferase [Pleionea sp. HL-JVS1]WMS86197.1 sulfotransferase [Pleionea sp. HL-JVS1]
MKKPNLFIIGAMKSGTTSLHHYLSHHNELFMSEPKEPGLFKTNDYSEAEFKQYMSLFDGANDSHKYRGEGSTDYAKIPQYQGVAQRLKEFSPDAKIIYVMRQPFKRTVSHYWHTRRPQVTDGQTKNMDQAIESFEGYLKFSDYPMQIQSFRESFGDDNIYYVLFEELTKSPEKVLPGIFEFLNVSQDFDYAVVNDQLNARPEKIMSATGKGLMHKLSYSKAWDILAKFVPKSLKTWLRGKAIQEVKADSQDKYKEIVRVKYEPYFSDIIERTGQLINRDLKNLWKL